ncbi:MAG: ATP-dependent Clp protease proteolytic subunit [Rhizobiaceae bacterium]|nr:ATP-dependent Clp protease proteolytic subunit [Rhizobiaceae bacterium]MCV0407595.1 ATP-dependent Clp protease proteolytic subunit [Rhizobiaceae bacterium]
MFPPVGGLGPEPKKAARVNPVGSWLSRFDDGELIRWAFRGLLVGAIGVLGLDLWHMADREGWFGPASPAIPQRADPVLPPVVRDDTDGNGTVDPRGDIETDPDTLRQPVRFSLQPGGVLAVTGSIDVGASTRFAEEIAQRGEYVKTVSLNSPGGSLADSLAISALIREKEISTLVADGAICASSCPLVLAGGVARSVEDKAAVGLHQFYTDSVEGLDAPQAMSDAQATTARITRHLSDMGVDPALWLHALETPPRRLYYLNADEMASYGLVTGVGVTARDGG